MTVYLFSAQNNLRTNRSRYQVTDEEQGGVRMTVKDKGQEQGKEKAVKKKTERELIAKKGEDEEGVAQVSRIRPPRFGLANK